MQQPLNGLAPVVVVGMQFEDPAVGQKVKHVMIISGLMALFTIVQNVYFFFELHAVRLLVSGMATALLVPACGYFGAKQRSKPLLGAFWCCNGCNACVMTTYIICVWIVMKAVHAKLPVGGEEETIQQLINNALPDMQTCCKELTTCDFSPTDCTGCNVKSLDTIMYPIGAPLCPDTDDDGSADGNGGAFCVDSNTCTGIEIVPDSFKLSDGIFYAVIAFLMLSCVPSTVACCLGLSLFNHPYMSQQPQAVGYMQAPQQVQAYNTYGGK